MLRKLLFLCLFVVSGVSGLQAESIPFMPEGKYKFNYDFSLSSADSIYESKTSKESMLERKLSKASLDDGAVSGSIKLETQTHLFQLQYGLGSSYNLNFQVPYYSKKRKSSLTDNQGTNQDFLDKYQSASTAGFGDYEIQILKRMNYTDAHDFQMGFGYNYNNAAFNYADDDKLALGSGTSEYSFFFNWTIYAFASNLKTEMHFEEIYTEFGKATDSNGESQNLKRKNSRKGSIWVVYYPDAFHYGGGFNFVDQAKSKVGNIELQDGYVSYAYELFYGLGNVVEMETGAVDTPWEGELYYNSVFLGQNADAVSTLGIRATFYF